jgi:hypothetical protein
MTADEFRAIALSLPDTIESSHMNHPDFRVGGRIFATLGYPSDEWGCVSLSPNEQKRVRQAEPDVFVPVKGAWGRAGATQVCLRPARKGSVRAALRAAWQNRVAKNASGKGRRPAGKARRSVR